MRALARGRANPLGRAHGVAAARAGQDHGELLAADARDHVHLADHVGQDLGRLAEHLVTGRVAMAVVELLEVVDVDQEQAEGDVLALPLGQATG